MGILDAPLTLTINGLDTLRYISWGQRPKIKVLLIGQLDLPLILIING